MITAVVGPAGSGKTTLFKRIGVVTIEADEVVRKAYTDPLMTTWCLDQCELSEAVVMDGAKGQFAIDRQKLAKIITADSRARRVLEDFLFINYFLPTMLAYRASGEDLIVEGVMPRFTRYFDRVVFVEMRKADRAGNLARRGNSPESISRLQSLQEGMFPTLFPEDDFRI